MEEKAKKLLIGSGVLAAGMSAISLAATKCMVDIALNRDEPRITEVLSKSQLRGSEKDKAFLEQLEKDAERLKNQPHELVAITAEDGEELVGHWFECEKPSRVIVAMHGWRSAWNRDFGMISDFWQKNGCSVLYAEQRGQGLSGGAYMGFGMVERHDCLQWVNWVNERCANALPVYLAGVSMGAATVLMATELELPSNVHGVMADCGFTSADAIWRHVAKNNLHISYGIRGSIVDSMCKRRIQMSAKDCSTVKILENNHIPVIFAHGDQDHFVPVEMTYENYQACAGPKRMLIVPGADHGMSYYLDKDRYEQMTLDFFRDFDAKQEA